MEKVVCPSCKASLKFSLNSEWNNKKVKVHCPLCKTSFHWLVQNSAQPAEILAQEIPADQPMHKSAPQAPKVVKKAAMSNPASLAQPEESSRPILDLEDKSFQSSFSPLRSMNFFDEEDVDYVDFPEEKSAERPSPLEAQESSSRKEKFPYHDADLFVFDDCLPGNDEAWGGVNQKLASVKAVKKSALRNPFSFLFR
jgi:hypothetical protein